MSVTWNDNTPIYLQLKERVVAMLLDGLLKPGRRFPPSARSLRNTNSTPSPSRGPIRSSPTNPLSRNAEDWACTYQMAHHRNY